MVLGFSFWGSGFEAPTGGYRVGWIKRCLMVDPSMLGLFMTLSFEPSAGSGFRVQDLGFRV